MYPSASPARAPLSWSGPQRGCRILGFCWQWVPFLILPSSVLNFWFFSTCSMETFNVHFPRV